VIRTSRKPKKLPICKGCRERKEPYRFGAKVCSISCAEIVAKAKSEKDARKLAKAVRATDKTRRDALKSRSDYLKEAQVVFNRFIRSRDSGQPCISCGTSSGCKINAGHFLSVGASPQNRFNENNVHLQCEKCNSYLSGNIAMYRPRLIAKIGLEAVEALEADQTIMKWSIADLKAITAKYRARLREMKGLK
jgi:hypothetical protein